MNLFPVGHPLRTFPKRLSGGGSIVRIFVAKVSVRVCRPCGPFWNVSALRDVEILACFKIHARHDIMKFCAPFVGMEDPEYLKGVARLSGKHEGFKTAHDLL
jgi:hypothetical protein